MWTQVLLALKEGEFYSSVILFLCFIGTVFFFERFFVYSIIFNMNFPKFMLNVKKALIAQDYERATILCKALPKKALSQILLRTLDAVENDPGMTKAVLDEEALALIPKIERRTNIFSLLAVLAVLIGVLASVDHIWITLQTISVLDSTKKQVAVISGMTGALHSTALGLLCGVVLICFQYFIRSMALRVTEGLHVSLTSLEHILAPPQYGTVAFAPVLANKNQQEVMETKSTSQETAQAEPDAPVVENKSESIQDIKDEEEII